jgi:FAD/FMN-containing dehydrogenase
VGLEVVTADGAILTATSEQNPDLFWAMRGAGANFGVATALEFQLHPIETVLSGNLRYPTRQARKILHFLDNFARTIPPELFLIAAVLPHPGERMLDVKIVWLGAKEKGERLLQPLRKYLRPSKIRLSLRPISMNKGRALTFQKVIILAIGAAAISKG